MTEYELYTSIILVTLLIVGLMGWLKGEFEKLSLPKVVPLDRLPEPWATIERKKWLAFRELMHDPELTRAEMLLPTSQPKRRKYRDNPTRGK